VLFDSHSHHTHPPACTYFLMATGRCRLPKGGIKELGKLTLQPLLLHPDCLAKDCIFLRRGVDHKECKYLGNPILQHLVDKASHASLHNSGRYGSGLCKFHIFCDVFSIPEAARLPASLDLLRLFVLWAVTDLDLPDVTLARCVVFEPVSINTAKNDLSRVRVWHLAQGWPLPLSDKYLDCMQWTMHSVCNLEAGQSMQAPVPTSHPADAHNTQAHLGSQGYL
jgi:hypothetical protein